MTSNVTNDELIVDKDKQQSSIPFVIGTLNSNQLRGLSITYLDPSVKSKKTVRYGKIVGIGKVFITICPCNKFAKKDTLTHLKASTLNIKFIEVRGIDSEGKEVISLIQEDILNLK